MTEMVLCVPNSLHEINTFVNHIATIAIFMFRQDDDYEAEDTAIECFTTPLDEQDCQIDEYIKFKNTLSGI